MSSGQVRRLAIMQPYLFPYLGYFQLLHAADEFLYYDDVAYIKQGWVNRNRVLMNGRETLFVAPVHDVSSFRAIQETTLALQYPKWRDKFLKTLQQGYARAHNAVTGLELVRSVFAPSHQTIADLAIASVEAVANYAGLSVRRRRSSLVTPKSDCSGAERVISICRELEATHYVNSPGGRGLYDRDVFAASGVCLEFLSPALAPYRQLSTAFVPGLSIIDVVMNCSLDELRAAVGQYALS